jgi:catechol 2,3-dioxygenase-like lactoylglutathione lyase family enzyme
MTPLGIDHVALRSFDLEATCAFYGKLLGLPLVEQAGGISQEWGGRSWRLAGFRLPSGALLDFFEVVGTPRPEPQGFLDQVAHVALQVGSRTDLEGWRERLRDHGCAIAEEQDHGDGRHSLYVTDPDGHYLELTCRATR